jgi:hypothetical protein
MSGTGDPDRVGIVDGTLRKVSSHDRRQHRDPPRRPAQRPGMRGVHSLRWLVAAPAPLHRMRTHRVLRQLAPSTRECPRRVERSSRHLQLRARRKLVLRLPLTGICCGPLIDSATTPPSGSADARSERTSTPGLARAAPPLIPGWPAMHSGPDPLTQSRLRSPGPIVPTPATCRSSQRSVRPADVVQTTSSSSPTSMRMSSSRRPSAQPTYTAKWTTSS